MKFLIIIIYDWIWKTIKRILHESQATQICSQETATFLYLLLNILCPLNLRNGVEGIVGCSRNQNRKYPIMMIIEFNLNCERYRSIADETNFNWDRFFSYTEIASFGIFDYEIYVWEIWTYYMLYIQIFISLIYYLELRNTLLIQSYNWHDHIRTIKVNLWKIGYRFHRNPQIGLRVLILILVYEKLNLSFK